MYYLLLLTVCFYSLTAQNSTINHAITDIKNNSYTGIESLLVFKNDSLISENYFNGYRKNKLHHTKSTFKSITGLLTAIAIDKKLFKYDDYILPILSNLITNDVIDKDISKIRVHNLLNMTSGLDCSEAGNGKINYSHEEAIDEGKAPFKYSLTIPSNSSPGEYWQYCNANSFLLGTVISAALKQKREIDIFKFAKQYLFQPLGITNYRLTKSNDGFLNAQGSCRFSSKDLGKIGLLVLNKGMWNGKRLIAAHHFKSIFDGEVEMNLSWTSTIPTHKKYKSRYAYQWHRTVFNIDEKEIPVSHSLGNGGQFIFVVPQMDMVVVFAGKNYGNVIKQKQAFEIMHKYLLRIDNEI